MDGLSPPVVAEEKRTRDLFGGRGYSWDPEKFVASDDRVRGGKSYSVFFVEGDRTPLAAFAGLLDPNQLDPPAGFAARRYDASICFPDLTTYDALVLDIPQSDGKKYTFFIKDTPPEKRPDGRLSASVSWEHDFHCPGPNGSGRVVLHLKDFKPFYRGKEVAGPTKPLDRSKIRSVGIMIRSFFGKQQGEFALCLLSITAYRYRPQTSAARELSANRVLVSRRAHRDSTGRWARFFQGFKRWGRKRRAR